MNLYKENKCRFVTLSFLLKTAMAAFLAAALVPKDSFGLSANKVWFEYHNGFIRVVFQYTLPEIKEFRGGYVEFTSKEAAEAYYWGLVRGGDFQMGSPSKLRFEGKPPKPRPW